MWSINQVPAKLDRSSSFHSIASSKASYVTNEEDPQDLLPKTLEMWSAPSTQTPAYSPQAPIWFRAQPPAAQPSQKSSHITTISVAPLPSSPSSRESSRSRDEQFEDDIRSRSSTLAGEEEEEEEDPFEYDYPQKTPTLKDMTRRLIDIGSLPRSEPHDLHSEPMEEILHDDFEEDSEDDSEDELEFEMQYQHEEPGYPEHFELSPHVPGPLELQLQALMSKIIHIEQEDPVASVTPEEYQALQSRLTLLEEDKKTWYFRHEALFALRDEDVENLISVRDMLATSRRDLEAITKLRDQDLINLQDVRLKLAEAIKKLEKLEVQPQSGKGSPTSIKGRPSSSLLERRDTTDLFAAAKAAALEQRALELEKRDEDLLAQLDLAKAALPPAPQAQTQARQSQNNIEVLSHDVAHKACKGTEANLNAKLKVRDTEIAILKAGSSTKPTIAAPITAGPLVPVANTYDWHRVEALHEEHASYREKVGGRMQRLRAEKEDLQKELHRKEDDCHALEVKVQSLQRRVPVT